MNEEERAKWRAEMEAGTRAFGGRFLNQSTSILTVMLLKWPCIPTMAESKLRTCKEIAMAPMVTEREHIDPVIKISNTTGSAMIQTIEKQKLMSSSKDLTKKLRTGSI
ncbi:MAG TPA: hypothetical protein V6C89_11145 [Drouetiella sp.]|jgi:hypothetical protein